jgi:cob(I)alamin adenosyltransferase
MKNSLIHLCVGDGKGKTTSAYGLLLRALGSGYRTAVFSFLKSDDSGEIAALRKLAGIYENLEINISQKKHGFFHSLCDSEKKEVENEVNALFSKLEKKINEEHCDLIVLDEIVDAINLNLVDENRFISLLSEKKCEIIMTGRNPSEKLIEISDYVSEVKKIKHPYDKGICARKGIEF